MPGDNKDVLCPSAWSTNRSDKQAGDVHSRQQPMEIMAHDLALQAAGQDLQQKGALVPTTCCQPKSCTQCFCHCISCLRSSGVSVLGTSTRAQQISSTWKSTAHLGEPSKVCVGHCGHQSEPCPARLQAATGSALHHCRLQGTLQRRCQQRPVRAASSTGCPFKGYPALPTSCRLAAQRNAHGRGLQKEKKRNYTVASVSG